jgi:hypothetical protein
MPNAEIISEIDAYLLCLRQALDLLSARLTGGRHERAPLHEKKIKVMKTAPTVSSRPRIQKNIASGSVVREGKILEKPVDPVSPGPSPVVRLSAGSEQPPVAATPLTATDCREGDSIRK